MTRVMPVELEPKGVTPCFCPSCMAAGGAARVLLREKWLASARRMLANMPAEREPRRRRVRRVRPVQPAEAPPRAPFADPRVLDRVIGVAVQKAGAR